MIVIGVRFKRVGKVYYFDPCGLTVKPGQYVIVETARGIECGSCAMGNTDVPEGDVVSPLKKNTGQNKPHTHKAVLCGRFLLENGKFTKLSRDPTDQRQKLFNSFLLKLKNEGETVMADALKMVLVTIYGAMAFEANPL